MKPAVDYNGGNGAKPFDASSIKFTPTTQLDFTKINSEKQPVNLYNPDLFLKKKQQPIIKKYAKGTGNATGGLSMVGERGPEMMNVPNGASIVPNKDTNRIQHGDTSLLSKWGISGYEKDKVGENPKTQQQNATIDQATLQKNDQNLNPVIESQESIAGKPIMVTVKLV